VHQRHLQRRRIDRDGAPCRHDESGEPCPCTWDYDEATVQALGYLGTADHPTPQGRAQALPPRFRYDANIPAEEVAQDLAARERIHRRRSGVTLDDTGGAEDDGDDAAWDRDADQGASWGWAVVLGAIVIAGLGLAWHRARLAGPPAPKPAEPVSPVSREAVGPP
jgi:hypothetical protein